MRNKNYSRYYGSVLWILSFSSFGAQTYPLNNWSLHVNGVDNLISAPVENISTLEFSAINHVVTTDVVTTPNPNNPFIGDHFITTGIGKLVSFSSLSNQINGTGLGNNYELTFDYQVAGVFVNLNPANGPSLIFDHINSPNSTDEMNWYIDNLNDNNGNQADNNITGSHSDGEKIATFKVSTNHSGQGEIGPNGGSDHVAFLLNWAKPGVFLDDQGNDLSTLASNASDPLLLFTIDTSIENLTTTFDGSACVNTPFDICDFENGVGSFNTAHAPIPASILLLLSGAASLGFVSRKKPINSHRH